LIGGETQNAGRQPAARLRRLQSPANTATVWEDDREAAGRRLHVRPISASEPRAHLSDRIVARPIAGIFLQKIGQLMRYQGVNARVGWAEISSY